MTRKFYLSTTAVTFASAGIMVAVAPALAADPPRLTVDPAEVDIFSADPVSGYVQAQLGVGAFDYYIEDNLEEAGSINRFGGAGRLNWWFSPNWSFQGDVYGTGFLVAFDGGEGAAWANGLAFGTAGHLSYRDPNSYLIGAMVSFGQTSGLLGDDGRWFTAAAQGQLYFNNLTAYGQIGNVSNVSGAAGRNILYAALQGRYFVTPNFAAIGDFTFANATGPDFGDQDNMVRVGLGLEFKPDMHPVSFFARYQGESHRIEGRDWEWRNHELLAGLKLFVNQPTLLANDRYGATLLDLNPQYGEFSSYFIGAN